MDSNAIGKNTETICEKYHSSISQNTAHKHISGIIEKIDPQKKYAFLEILENKFKNILSCSTCKCLLKNNSSAFNCGHTYCEQCSINLDKCPTCKDQGNIRTAIKDFSKILNIIGEIKSDFNSDRFLYEVIRFLLFGSKIPECEEDMDEATSTANNNTPPITHQSKDESLKKSRKLASKIKKQKTPLTAGENSRKRLKFDKTNTPQTSDATSLENDSENLFVETVKTRKSYGRKTISYLETQPALSEINAGGSSTSKRKRETDLQSDSSLECLKRAKKKTDSESPMDSDKRQVSVRLPKIMINSETSSPELQSQGMFYGFAQNEIGQSDQKLTKLKRCMHSTPLNCTFPLTELKSNHNVDLSIGESKQPRALEPPKKSISMLEAVKSTVGEVKIENAFATVRDADTEELDLDVWKRNDKNDKKKRLFKSVKERNKRDVSISGTLDSLLDRQKLINKEKSSPKGNPQESNEGKNIPTNDPSKGQPISTENSSITNTPKAKQIPIQHPQINHLQKETKSTPKKMIPLKVEKTTKNTSPVKTTNKTLTSLPSPEKIQSTERSISPTKVPINVSKLDEPTSTTITTETTSEIPAENNSVGKAEKPKPKKLGLPLFADSIDPDIFSQKGTICSSTPCGPTKFKVSKTYSKAKNKLFDKTIADLSPIVERDADHFDVKNKSKISPLRNKHDSPALDDSLMKSSIMVQAEVHEAPVSQCDQPVLKNKPIESPLEVTTSEAQPAEKTSTKSPTKEKLGADIGKPLDDILASPSTSEVEKIQTKVKEISPIAVSSVKPIVDVDNEVVAMEVDDVDKVLQSVDKINTEIIPTITPQKVIPEEPVTPYKESSLEKRRNKVRKLQQEINTKNEKSLSDLKKNFNRISPKLSIERVKNAVNASSSSKSPNCGASEVSEKMVDQNEEKNEISSKAKTPEMRSPEIPSYDDTIPTQKFPNPRKHVACQTSDDLLEDLLKEKFPHLLEKSDPKNDYPSSVYDTPMEQNNDVPLTAKTPDLNAANKTTKTPATNTSAKYTLISSITSSERKFAEKHFMNDSVLCDSPFTIGSANKTGNVSGYAPLTPEHRTEEKKKLSCRLNFITDTDDLLANFPMGDDPVNERVESPVPNAEVSPKTNEVAQECDGANSADAVEHITRVNDKSDEVTDRSHEIVFNDSINDKIQELCDRVEQEGVVASASILENTVIGAIEPGLHEDQADEDKTFFESDSVAVIPDTEATIFHRNSPTSSLRRESNVNEKIADKVISCANENDKVNDDKIMFDDDDDIDFVAGTPTSQPTRFISASLEKNKTPRRLFDQILQTPISGLAVKQNITPNISSIEPLADISRFSNVKQPNPVVDVTPTLERNDEDSGKVSVELLNSDVLSNSTSFDSIHVSTSGLKEPDLKMITKFCEKFGAIYSDKLNDKSTHLVVKIDENNKAARTFKFLQAIVSGVRIVSMNWVRECLTKNKIVSEAKFIPLDSSGECGPLRTYNLIKGLTPSPLSWLQDYCIYFTEPVPEECTLEQLQGIMRKTGAIVLNSITEFKKYPNHHHIIIVSEEDEDDEDVDECVEKNSLGWKVAEWYKTYRAVAIEFNWMLEVIGRNKLVPFADYEVREYPPAYLLSINFPAEMLKPDEDNQTSD